MRKVKLITDYANKKEGDILELDGMVASDLVRNQKVCVYTDLIKEETEKEVEETEKEVEETESKDTKIKEVKTKKVKGETKVVKKIK